MNKKLSLLLASSIISVGIILSGNIVNAKMINHSSNGSLMESWGTGLKEEFAHIDTEKISEQEKTLSKFTSSIKRGDFNVAEDYLANVIQILMDYRFNNQQEFNSKTEELIDTLKEISYAYPTSAYPKYYMAKLYQLSDNFDYAFYLIKECINMDRKNPVFKYELGNFYLATNQNEKAIRVFEQLKLQYPREKEIRVSLAEAYYKMASFDNSVREYRVAAAFEPEDSDTVAALVSAATYAKMVKNNTFYDPMQTVTATSTPYSGNRQDVIAFNAGANSSFSASQPYTTNLKDANGQSINATPQAVEKVSEGSKYVLVNQNENVPNYTNEQGPQMGGMPPRGPQMGGMPSGRLQANAPQTQNQLSNEQQRYMKEIGLKQVKPKITRAASSNKRVMVSYVNGRKVVKIVNISQDGDASQTLSNSSQTLARQLADSNSNPSYYDSNYEQANGQIKTGGGEYTFTSYKSPASNMTKESDIFSSENQSYTTSKYNYNEKDYYSNDAERNVADIQSAQNKPRKLLVTNKYGQKATEPVSKVSDKKLKKQDNNTKTKETTTKSQTSAENAELYLKANELLAQNQYQAVIDLLSKINPPTLRSLTSIASCYNALGNTEAAIEYYNKADKISPDNSQILFSLAYLYFSKNQVDTAKNYVNRSLQIDPNNANALQLKNFISQQDSNDDMNKAVSYMNSGNYSDSKKILDKLAQSDSSNFQVYYYLGHICYATQKYAEAVQDFLKAVKLNSEYALSYYSLGLAYDKLKKFNDSLASYEKFIQMSTDDNKYTQYAKTRINTIKSKK